MLLLQKTNADWWSVKKANRQDGYVPANYVKEVDPKIVQKKVKKPVKVQEKVKVPKQGVKKEMVKKKKSKGSGSLRRTPSSKGDRQGCPITSLINLNLPEVLLCCKLTDVVFCH